MDASRRFQQDATCEAFLRHVPMFAELSETDYSKLVMLLRKQRYKKGEVIFRMEDPGSALFFLRSGVVKASFELSDDHRGMVTSLLYPPDFFGEMALLDGQPRSVTVAALEPSEVFVLEREAFTALLEDNPSLLLTIASTLSRRVRKTNELVHSLAFQNAHSRVARVLFGLSLERGEDTAQGTRIGLRLTQRELADLAGTTRETTAHVLRDFRQAGYLRLKNGEITIVQSILLEEMAQA